MVDPAADKLRKGEEECAVLGKLQKKLVVEEEEGAHGNTL